MTDKTQTARREEAKTKRKETRAVRDDLKAEKEREKIRARNAKDKLKEEKLKNNLEMRKQGKPTHGFGVWRNKPKNRRK